MDEFERKLTEEFSRNVGNYGMTKTVIIDVDGVLTDGKVWYNQTGERMKAFHSRDIRAIRELVSHGFSVVLYTQSTWPGLKDYAKRTGAEIVIRREKIPVPEKYIMVGDDTPDIELMKGSVKAYCPRDADREVFAYCEILDCYGGSGVIAELVRVLSL